MKKLFLFALLIISVISCKKKEEDVPDPVITPDPTPALVNVSTTAPSSFSQKVLIEEFTGAWCGYCPDGAYRLDEILSANEKAIGVSIHAGDDMEISTYTTLDNTFNITGFPSGMVNRLPSAQDGKVPMSRSYWSSNTTTNLAKTAKCGLAIQGNKLSGNNITVTVYAAFNQALTGTYTLTIYLVEDSVTGTGSGYDQANYMSSSGAAPDPNSIYYDDPPTITGFNHMHVLRETLTDDMGDTIPSNVLVADGKHTITKTVDISAYKISDLKIIAFVSKIGSSGTTHEIMNVQEASFYPGQLTGKNWD